MTFRSSQSTPHSGILLSERVLMGRIQPPEAVTVSHPDYYA